MQTERVTFLTSPHHKAALTGRASAQGISVGEYIRRRTDDEDFTPGDEAELAMLVAQVNANLPRMSATLDHMIETLERTNRSVSQTLGRLGHPE